MAENHQDFGVNHGRVRVRENVQGCPSLGYGMGFFSSCDRGSGHGGSFGHASPSLCHDGPCRGDGANGRGNGLCPYLYPGRDPCSFHDKNRVRTGGVPCTLRESEREVCQ